MALAHHKEQQARSKAVAPFACLTVDVEGIDGYSGPKPETGEYEFALTLLRISGALDRSRLVPIVFERASGRRVESLEDRLLRIIQDFATDDLVPRVSPTERRELEARAASVAASIADQAEADAIERNEATIAVRRATLERTFGHRIQRRRELMAEAQDEKIRRMRSGEITNLEAGLAKRIRELDSKRSVAVTRTPIGVGRLRIVSGQRGEVEAVQPDPRAEPDEVGGYPEPPNSYGVSPG
jgi:hypothetical protein